MENDKVVDFYDPFYSKRENIVINERVYNLYKRLKKAGADTSSNVIELGCGAGAFTFLLSKLIRNGNIEAIDISPAAISIAKQNCTRENVRFSQDDMFVFTPATFKQADFITLFDVLEHVPAEKHEQLIKHISSLMHDESTFLLNIPNPKQIEYDILHDPTLLQIVDQPVFQDHLIVLLSKYHLCVQFMEIYGVWNSDDYQFFLIKRDKPFKPVAIKKSMTIYQRIKRKLERIFVKIFYQYPIR